MTDSTTMIAVVAFDKDDAGTLFPAGEPQRFESEDQAVDAAKELASKHDGVIAWSRQAGPDEQGPSRILYKAGEAIDME
jgi:hypothetical protein